MFVDSETARTQRSTPNNSSRAPAVAHTIITHERTAEVWDGETGEWLAGLEGDRREYVGSVAVWKEHTGGHDRIATAGSFTAKVWDGEAFTLLHDLDCDATPVKRLLAFESAEGRIRLLVALANKSNVGPCGVQVWDPEEGRLLHDGIKQDCPFTDCHLFETTQGRHLLAIAGRGVHHLMNVWDLGEAPARAGAVRPAHRVG
jgi:hypothetical protein